MLRKSFSIKRSENSKVRAFNLIKSGTCFSPVLLLLRQHLKYQRLCQRSVVTGDGNWWDKHQNNRKQLKSIAVGTWCKTSINICPRSGWQHSCGGLHAPKEPCRNAKSQPVSLSPVPTLKRLPWVWVRAPTPT